MKKHGWMSTGLMLVVIAVLLVVILTPWEAARGQLLQLQGKVTEVNPSLRSVTVLNSETSEPVVLQLGRDAFEPGQSWKNLHQKPRVKVVATYNFDGTVQARRLVLL
ncbi:MAG: hypothetical protein KF760_34175 [Candidatus Eremiobacteraeota bacterium]|nr:hypothetical protein [Candidatus Eremiobacteraeota bacterium]